MGNCTAVGGGGCAGWRGRRTRRWRAGTGTPTSGRHSPPQAGGREGPEVRGWFTSRPGPRRSASSGRPCGARLSLGSAQRCRPEVGVPCPVRRPAHGGTRRDGNHSAGWRGAPPAGLRPAVPTGGRRSLPCAPPCPRGDAPRREPLHGLATHAFRWAPPSGADRRSGVPCPVHRPARGRTGRDGNHSTGWRGAPPAGLRPAVPTGGPAFPALCAALPTGGRAETGTTPRIGWTPLRGPVDRACRCEHRRSLACAPLRHLGAALYRERFFLYSSVRRTGVPAKP